MDPGAYEQGHAAGAPWQHPLQQNDVSMDEKMVPPPYPPPYEKVIEMNAPPTAPIWQQYPQGNGPTEATPLSTVPGGRGDGRVAQTQKSGWTIPTVDVGCFGCCSLETYCKVQGYLTAIGSVFVCIVAIFLVFGPLIFVQASATSHGHLDPAERHALSEVKVVTAFIAIMGVVLLVLAIITFVCAVRFIKGINQRAPHMMVSYIRILYVHLIFQVIKILLEPISMLQGILYFAFASYNVICARSLHEKMLNESDDQIRNKNDV